MKPFHFMVSFSGHFFGDTTKNLHHSAFFIIDDD